MQVVDDAGVLQHGALRAARAARREDDVAHAVRLRPHAWRRGLLPCQRIALAVHLPRSVAPI